MSLELQGKIVSIGDTQQVNDRFSKREFVLELTDEINGNSYKNYAKMQLVQAKCGIMDNYKVGDDVKAQFNVKGNRWEKDGKVDYITNLDVWKCERMGSTQHIPAPVTQDPNSPELPF